MEKNADLYNLTQQVQGTVYQAGQKAYLESLSDEERDNQPQRPQLLNIRGGYAESIGWMLVQLLEFDPEPLTVEKFRKRAVYSAPRLSQALLELIASEKWASRTGEEYQLTEAGHEVIDTLIGQRNMMFTNFEPIPTDELKKLSHLSQRIFDSTINSNDEDATWCLWHSQRRKPTDNDPLISQFIHVCNDYNAFRDDAHMAAYHEQGVDGMTWEAFSFVDDGNAKNAEDLFDQLAYRGWTIEEWQDALNRLVKKGWLENKNDSYDTTDTGKEIRKIVEQKTDELFFEPWAVLSHDEQVDYVRLLHKLNDKCTALLSE